MILLYLLCERLNTSEILCIVIILYIETFKAFFYLYHIIFFKKDFLSNPKSMLLLNHFYVKEVRYYYRFN